MLKRFLSSSHEYSRSLLKLQSLHTANGSKLSKNSTYSKKELTQELMNVQNIVIKKSSTHASPPSRTPVLVDGVRIPFALAKYNI